MSLRCSLVPKLPAVSGRKLLKALTKMGHEIVRQKGSYVRSTKKEEERKHHITVPMHEEIKRGTLNDIITKVAKWNGVSKEKVIDTINNA